MMLVAHNTVSIGYPVLTFVKRTFLTTDVTNVSVNATGQVRFFWPTILELYMYINFHSKVAAIGNFGLIDLDTPSDAYTITSLYSGNQMKLVFSDEFNTDGRTFYPGLLYADAQGTLQLNI